ncbi:endonuclease [Endozoicomonas sp. SM1973]|uniref:Endonuclease n=2 Tax=Spartinivicinus marinus TaxID=2994442 RepID=A0A853IIL7_9GAMM|nr:endonuclease [Spartinivicinus marinus]
MIKQQMLACIFILAYCNTAVSQNQANQLTFNKSPTNFYQAKRILKEIYKNKTTTFYCGCKFYYQDNKLVLNHHSCGYQTRQNQERANRIEWEHIMPASYFGRKLDCWKQGGRKYCQKHSKAFRQMEADLHNLEPAIGEINGDRSNFAFAMVRGEYRHYGQCDIEIDFKHDRVEPKPSIRGNIARVYLYMAKKYSLTLSKQEHETFTKWAKRDPITRWERKKAALISNYQSGLTPVDLAQ